MESIIVKLKPKSQIQKKPEQKKHIDTHGGAKRLMQNDIGNNGNQFGTTYQHQIQQEQFQQQQQQYQIQQQEQFQQQQQQYQIQQQEQFQQQQHQIQQQEQFRQPMQQLEETARQQQPTWSTQPHNGHQMIGR